MSETELLTIYNEYIQGPSIMTILLVPVTFIVAVGLMFVAIKYKLKGGSGNQIINYLIGIVAIGLLITCISMVFGLFNYQDKDYSFVEKEYIKPFILSREATTFTNLEITSEVVHGGRWSSTAYKIGGLLESSVGAPRSKLKDTYDASFKLHELEYYESKQDYSYIEVRRFPFYLNETYNTNYFSRIAYLTADDMLALLKDHPFEVNRIDKDFAEKLGIEKNKGLNLFSN